MSSISPDDTLLDRLLADEPTRTATLLAYWLSLERADQGLSRTREATRSTIIWALLAVDPDVESAFGTTGTVLEKWTQGLGLKTDPDVLRIELEKRHGAEGRPVLHPDLTDACDRHLELSVDGGPPTATELAVAILESIETGKSRVLPDRLKALGIDPPEIIDRLNGLAPTRAVDLHDFSASVLHVIDRIGLATEVTPAHFAAELGQLHPDYAGGLLGSVDFGDNQAVPHRLADILATVRHMAGDLASGEVIHTRQVLVHLASFDDGVHRALARTGAYDKLLSELGMVAPVAPMAAPTSPSGSRPSLVMLADVPVDDPVVDAMNFGPYVEAVVQLIENPRTTTPLSIAINGPWGSGKTSLGRMVEKRLEQHEADDDRFAPIVSWFNAWLHDGADDLGAALTAHVGRELNVHRPWWRRIAQLLPKNMLTARQRYRRKLWVAGLGALITAAVALGWVQLTTDGIVGGSNDETAAVAEDEGAVPAAAEGGAFAALVLTIVAAASRFADPARSAAAFIASPRSEAQEGALNEARNEIGTLLEQAGVPRTRNMVIFVDDLERSRPPSAIDICEVANQLLDHPGVFIVYLADMAKIASTVEIKYRDYAGWSAQPDNHSAVNGSSAPDVHPTNGHRRWGRAYMEKMVQIQIDIPELDLAAGSQLLSRITANSRDAADRRLEEQRRGRDAWLVGLARPYGIASDWVRDRRKHLKVKRLNRLVNSNRRGGKLDVDAFRVDAKRAGLDPEVVGRVIARNTEESETYRRAEAVAVDFLPNNPRAIKRLANRLRFSVVVAEELGRVFEPDLWVDPRLVGKWAVLTTRWPTLIESLRSGEINIGDLESQREKDLTAQLKRHVRPEVESQEIDQITRLLGDDPTFGESIDQFLYHRLAPLRSTDEPRQLEPTHPL